MRYCTTCFAVLWLANSAIAADRFPVIPSKLDSPAIRHHKGRSLTLTLTAFDGPGVFRYAMNFHRVESLDKFIAHQNNRGFTHVVVIIEDTKVFLKAGLNALKKALEDNLPKGMCITIYVVNEAKMAPRITPTTIRAN